MYRDDVESSDIKSVGYDKDSKVLEVEFLKGTIYEYRGVPYEVYVCLMVASSKGAYLATHIKPHFKYAKIN